MNETLPRAELIQEIIEQLHVISRYVGPGREQLLLKIELNHAQLKFLYLISTDDKLTIPRLVKLTRTTPGAITQMVDGLIQKGFLVRIKDPLDNRRIFIRFSARGRSQFLRLRKLHIQFLHSWFEVLSDEELAQMVAIEKKIVSNLSNK